MKANQDEQTPNKGSHLGWLSLWLDRSQRYRTLPLLLLPLILLSMTHPSFTHCSSPKKSLSLTDTSSQPPLQLVFYNVENLFDTINDPTTNDEDFLPTGVLHWNKHRYSTKLKKIGWVLSNIAGWQLPDIIGLVEIENRRVIEDLLQHPSLRHKAYSYAVTKGADPRGIDVALIWDRYRFQRIGAWEIPHYGKPLRYPLRKDQRTTSEREGSGRNSLWVRLEDKVTKVRYDLFVIHAPSRRQGTKVSGTKRQKVLQKVYQNIHKLLGSDPDRRIIVMGDFNDNPSNPPVRHGLHSRPFSSTPTAPDSLYNLATKVEQQGEGTHRFQRQMWVPDQFLISRTLCTEVLGEGMIVFRHPQLLDRKGQSLRRTYQGRHYKGGYSDHLPILLRILPAPASPQE